MAASPQNLAVFKGIVSWKPAGASTFRDLGEVSALTITPELENIEYFSARSGVRTKVRDVVVQKSATLTMTIAEMTVDNIALGILGTVAPQVTGDPGFIVGADPEDQRQKVLGLAQDEVLGSLRYVGTNSVGRRFQVDVPSVSFKGGAALNLLSEEWATFEMTGEVLEDDGVFFRLFEIESPLSPTPPPTP